MDPCLVSVIVPVYNVEKYIDQCVQSIIDQTYRNLEIILVNDGSTDSSGELCRIWKNKDTRIILVEKENGGLSDARNAGIENANGEYYAFIDSDDYISEDMIQSMMDCLQESHSEIAVCNMKRFYEDGNTADFYRSDENSKVLCGNDRFKTLKQPSVCNKLFKKTLFEEIRFPKGKYYEDTYVYHELLFKADGITFTGKDSYWYRSRPDSILGSRKYTVKYFDFVEAVYNRASFLMEKNIQPYGYEACMSLYAAMSNAERYLGHDPESSERLKKARIQYRFAYSALMSREAKTGAKQKVRLIILRYLPDLHTKMY